MVKSMSHDAMNSWAEKAKSFEPLMQAPHDGVHIITCDETRNKGSVIMEIAERIRPWLMQLFDGVRDENGMLVQPSHIRGIALNVAQNIVREQGQ